MLTPNPARSGPALVIRGRSYPILLPKLRDPRLQLAAVIVSLQILGQVAFDFKLSIAQILVALVTCAVLEVGIAAWKQHVIMWPASALLTGNGVAFILRVPGTVHGDWWSMNGWWIYAGTAAVSLLSKYVITFRGGHIFNPSNFGLVLCFLILGKNRAFPLEFWWGPMSPWMALALALIVLGGLAILLRIHLLEIAVGFWVTFAAATGVLALAGHEMTASYHLGPMTGSYFWRVLITSPEILVFTFFMITDPKTIPKRRAARRVYAIGIGLLSTLLMARQTTEFGTKVALLGALTLVCAVRPLLEWALPDGRVSAWTAGIRARRRAGTAGLGLAGLVAARGVRGSARPRRPAGAGELRLRVAARECRSPSARDDRPLERRLVPARQQHGEGDRRRPDCRPPYPLRRAEAAQRRPCVGRRLRCGARGRPADHPVGTRPRDRRPQLPHRADEHEARARSGRRARRRSSRLSRASSSRTSTRARRRRSSAAAIRSRSPAPSSSDRAARAT